MLVDPAMKEVSFNKPHPKHHFLYLHLISLPSSNSYHIAYSFILPQFISSTSSQLHISYYLPHPQFTLLLHLPSVHLHNSFESFSSHLHNVLHQLLFHFFPVPTHLLRPRGLQPHRQFYIHIFESQKLWRTRWLQPWWR
jgi:hypothetical protein